MNLKQVTFWTLCVLSLVLAMDVLSFFMPIIVHVIPGTMHWIGFVFAASTFFRDVALVCFFAFLYKRS